MTLDLEAIQAELEDRIKMTQHHPDTVPTFMWVLSEALRNEEQIPVITGVVTPDQLWAMLAGLERGDGEPVRVAIDCVITVVPRPQLNLDFLTEVGEIKGQGPVVDAETTQAIPELPISVMPYGPGVKDGFVLSHPGVDDLRVPCSRLEWALSEATGARMLLSEFHDDLTPEERKDWVGQIRLWLDSIGYPEIAQGPIR